MINTQIEVHSRKILIFVYDRCRTETVARQPGFGQKPQVDMHSKNRKSAVGAGSST